MKDCIKKELNNLDKVDKYAKKGIQLDQPDNDVCLIIPALDEAENLALLLPLLRRQYRVVVVDNASEDNTSEVARQHHAELVYCPNRGYGNTIMAALQYLDSGSSHPKVVVIYDADGSSAMADIQTVAAPILAQEADLVIGQRTLAQRGSLLFHAKLGNALSVMMIHWLTGHRYSDLGPLRAISISTLFSLDMVDRTWGWNVEMQMKAVWHNLKILEIPIVYKKRRFGRSTISGSIWGSIRAGSKILSRIIYFKVQHMFRSSEQSLTEYNVQ